MLSAAAYSLLYPGTNPYLAVPLSSPSMSFRCWHAVATERSFGFRYDIRLARLFNRAFRCCSQFIHQTSTSSFNIMETEKVQDRIFQCPKCRMAFHRKFELKNHNRVHTDERPYVCEFACGASFRWRSCLHYHRNKEVCTKRTTTTRKQGKKERSQGSNRRRQATQSTTAAASTSTRRSTSRRQTNPNGVRETPIVRLGNGTDGMLFNMDGFQPFSDPLFSRSHGA